MLSDNGLISGIQGIAYVKDLSTPNHLALKFPNIPLGEYNVWETDYTGYALVYSCTQIIPLVLKNELIFILSRQTTLEKTTIDRLKSLLTNNGVSSVSNLIVTDQSSC